MYGMTSPPAASDPRRRGPLYPMQRWADENPAQGLLFIGAFVAFGLAMTGLELVENNRPDYFFVALFVLLAARAAWTMWRQYQRIRHW